MDGDPITHRHLQAIEVILVGIAITLVGGGVIGLGVAFLGLAFAAIAPSARSRR